jgi:hypothetical protein
VANLDDELATKLVARLKKLVDEHFDRVAYFRALPDVCW